MKKPPMPEYLYVRKSEDDFLAWETREEAIEDDGPTDVGVYKLVVIRKMRKEVVVIS